MTRTSGHSSGAGDGPSFVHEAARSNTGVPAEIRVMSSQPEGPLSPDPFHDPATVARYARGVQRTVPGVSTLHALVEQILAESVPHDGRLLVVGAGGGLELTHLAGRHAGWTFVGVDPSAEMLRLARETMGPLAPRATLHLGHVHDGPEGPFDGATCLLTLHFVPAEERLRMLRAIHGRLRAGSPLLTFHHSVPAGRTRTGWLRRAARFAAGADGDAEQIDRNAEALAERLPLLAPHEDAALLHKAGFHDVETYYSALTFRGWLAYA